MIDLIDRIASALARVTLWLGAVLLLLMAFHVTVDVISRSFFNAPIAATLEFGTYYYMVAASFLADYPGLIASGFASGLFVAFTLVGLAIIHNISWNNALRPLILIAVYVFILFFNPISGLAIASLALIEPLLPLRKPENGGYRPPRAPE